MAATACTQVDWNAVSAIATAAATVVALGLAYFQIRSTRKVEIERATLVASAIAPRLQALCVSLQDIDGQMWFQAEDGQNISAETLKYMIKDASPPDVSTDELISLAGLGNNCGNRLAFGRALLAEFAKEVNSEARQYPSRPVKDELLSSWQATFNNAQAHIMAVTQQCVRAATKHAPTPTGEEIHGAPPISG